MGRIKQYFTEALGSVINYRGTFKDTGKFLSPFWKITEGLMMKNSKKK
jgi:hypothetical protein